MGIINLWLVVNVWTGNELEVKAIGPRDALFSISGWERTESRAGWMYAGGWKVNLVPVRKGVTV